MKASFGRDTGDMRWRTCFPAAGWLLFALLGACGAESKHEPDIRFMAKVNGEVITVREFNERFARLESGSGPDLKTGKRQVLGVLVDEKLLAQNAIRSGLDREPGTIAVLDRMRRQILAQAAIDRASGASLVSDFETREFYEEHPDLFERRKTYVFRRFDLLAAELPPPLKFELDKARSSAEVGLILKRASMRFSDQTEVRAAETFAVDTLKQVAQMQRGDILITKEAGQVVLLQLMRSIPEPVELARAAPAIHSYLADRKKRKAAEDLLRNLREGAKIEYSEEATDGFQVQADAGLVESAKVAPNGQDASRIGSANRWR